MIDSRTLTIGWINEVSAKNRKADKILVEKVIRALLLLEGLAKIDLDFVFKGGTALMLLLGSSRRLSIDIDIILPKKPENLETLFQKLTKLQHFTRFEPQYRETSGTEIKKAHYKFFYPPLHKTRTEEEYVLLDILFEEPTYQHLIELPVKSKFVVSGKEGILVKLPSKNDLLGDKLTAFAPNTTGIPYFKKEKGMGMEIIKQLYDIASLVDVADDIKTVGRTFKNFAATELGYRHEDNLSYEDVLEDIIQTALCLVSRGAAGEGNFGELQNGIQRISRFVFSEPFYLDKAITMASKAAYIASAIKHNKEKIETFGNPMQMKEWRLTKPLWPRLNRLKKSNPEAFFYWYKINEMSR